MPEPVLYLDAASTTPLHPRALVAMTGALELPSQAEVAASSRARLAAQLGVPPGRLSLAPSGTAANALALTAGLAQLEGRRVVSQPTEHPSVREPLRQWEAAGGRVTWLPVDPSGRVDPEALERELGAGDVGLVSVMLANHETGVLQPWADLAEVCRRAHVLLHADGVQALRTCASTPGALGPDLVTFAGHKVFGPKGVAGVLCSERAPDLPPGGAPLAALLGLEAALAERDGCVPSVSQDLAASRDALESGVLAALEGVTVNGGGAPRLPTHTNLSFAGISGEALVLELDRAGVAASSGAACSSGDGRPSPVLLALGATPARARGSLRLSLARPLDADEVRRVIDAVARGVARLRALTG